MTKISPAENNIHREHLLHNKHHIFVLLLYDRKCNKTKKIRVVQTARTTISITITGYRVAQKVSHYR